MIDRLTSILVLAAFCFIARTTAAGEIDVTVPDNIHVSEAEATAPKTKSTIRGVVDGRTVRFRDAAANTSYDVKITGADGTVFQGVDLGWYSLEPPRPDAEALSDDDRQQTTDILKQVLSFYNRNDLLILRGTHDRAVALVQLIRDKAFHSDQGGEVIWHIELWYLRNQHGGWEKVQQSNKIVRRERFASRAEYDAVVKHLRWIPELGGLKLNQDGADLRVDLPSNAGTESP
jgi:hypothetical protein